VLGFDNGSQIVCANLNHVGQTFGAQAANRA
jgi:hypothetical protein